MEPRHGASSFKYFLALCVALPYLHWGKYEFHLHFRFYFDNSLTYCVVSVRVCWHFSYILRECLRGVLTLVLREKCMVERNGW